MASARSTGERACARLDACRYTLKMVSKAAITAAGSATRTRYEEELKMAAQMCGQSRFVPLALTTFEDAKHICAVYPVRVALSLRDGEHAGAVEPTRCPAISLRPRCADDASPLR